MLGARLNHVRSYIRQNGLGHTAMQAWGKAREHCLKTYDRWYRSRQPGPETLAAQRAQAFDAPPLISVVVPVFNTRRDYLEAMAESVLRQSYPHWELCLADGGSEKLETLDALKALAQRDERIKVFFAPENLGIAGNTNRGIEMARGAYVALMDHDDTLAPDALYWIAEAIQRTGAEMLYTDEDKMHREGRYYFAPHLKPDYSPDLLKSCNYICHLMALKRSLLARIGGLQTGFDGSQDHELALRAAGAARGICHIPRVLYHWRQVQSSMSHQNMQKCLDAAQRAVEAQLLREGRNARVEILRSRCRVVYGVEGEPEVTVLLWHEGTENQLAACLAAIRETADYPRLKIRPLSGSSRPRALNQAVREAEPGYLVFMDSQVLPGTRGWVAQWLGYCQRPECLSVCPKLVTPGGRLAFAGYLVGMEKGVSVPQGGLPGESWGYFGIKEMLHNVAASSWAFMMVNRQRFLDVGGFDEGYRRELADVDWCLRASSRGGWHLYDPYARGVAAAGRLSDPPQSQADLERFQAQWPQLRDPYYNPQFTRRGGGYQLAKNSEGAMQSEG